jgi:hypothetical protein
LLALVSVAVGGTGRSGGRALRRAGAGLGDGGRRVRQSAGHARRLRRRRFAGSAGWFRAHNALLVIAFAGAGHLIHVELDLDLAGEIAVAQHRGQQRGHLTAQLVLHAGLHFQTVAVRPAAIGQQAPRWSTTPHRASGPAPIRPPD